MAALLCQLLTLAAQCRTGYRVLIDGDRATPTDQDTDPVIAVAVPAAIVPIAPPFARTTLLIAPVRAQELRHRHTDTFIAAEGIELWVLMVHTGREDDPGWINGLDKGQGAGIVRAVMRGKDDIGRNGTARAVIEKVLFCPDNLALGRIVLTPDRIAPVQDGAPVIVQPYDNADGIARF